MGKVGRKVTAKKDAIHAHAGTSNGKAKEKFKQQSGELDGHLFKYEVYRVSSIWSKVHMEKTTYKESHTSIWGQDFEKTCRRPVT
jgi:hypothetical protein